MRTGRVRLARSVTPAPHPTSTDCDSVPVNFEEPDMCVQPSEVGLLGLGLTGEVRLDLLRYIHLTPHASNELSHAGSDGRRPSIAGVRMDGRQPRTERPSPRAASGAPWSGEILMLRPRRSITASTGWPTTTSRAWSRRTDYVDRRRR